MLKPLVIATFLVASCAAGLTGCASTAPRGDKALASASPAKEQPNDCIRDTGSRVKMADDKCMNVAGRSYSQDDIDRTGRTNVAEALRQLDPSIH